MTVTLELGPEELTALRYRADREGVDIETVLHRLIAQIAVPTAPAEADKAREPSGTQNGLAVFLQSRPDEDRTGDPEEQAERERELEESKANINRWRAEQGRPPVR